MRVVGWWAIGRELAHRAEGARDEKAAGEAQFEFRILRGHTAEQLLKHRDVSVAVFVGFAFMGLATIATAVGDDARLGG